MSIPETLGERLRVAMKDAGVKNADVARAAGVHLKTVSYWLNGQFDPSDSALDLIAPIVKRSRSWIRYGDESPRPMVVREPAPTALPRWFKASVHELERDAHRLGATHEDMDFIRASLDDPAMMVRLLEDAELQRPLTDDEEREEFNTLRDELLAWLRRRIELREKRRRQE